MTTTIGIYAHVDAGKTTLSEQLLYKCGLIKKLGRVDKKDTFMDYNELEKNRGITIFADEAHFEINDSKYCIIDTPGHIDFSGEMERSILAIDLAVIVVSSVEGVQSHTETIWKLLKKYNKPCILFLNKADRDIADPKSVINYINNMWKCNTIIFDKNFENGTLNENIIEDISLYDEEVMNKYLSGELSNEYYTAKTKELINNRIIYPVIIGSALNNIGIDTLIKVIYTFFNENSSNKSIQNEFFSAVIYKIRHDKNNVRNTFIKVLSGNLKVKDVVDTVSSDGETVQCKINGLKQYNGEKSYSVSEVKKGDICAVTGLTDVKPGDIIGHNTRKGQEFSLTPLMQVKVIFDKNININKMLYILKEIEDEEMLLHVQFNEHSKEISIQIMGEIQLETLKDVVKQRYNIDIDFGESEILYKETIKGSSVGCGHFEPLRHYAEVHLGIKEGARNSGITFESKCPVDMLSQNYQNLIKTHVYEKQHSGVLIGAPVTDLKITLLSGKAHLKHTNGGDFRQAVYRAIRQGLMYAENVILEPWYKFEIIIQVPLMGKVLMDIQNLKGQYDAPDSSGENAVIKGRCPVKTMQKYIKEFMIFTKGKGKINLNFDGYYPCTDEEDVIKNKNYNPEEDVNNTADSVFCSHGSGYIVKWNESKDKMHLPVEEI